MRRSIIGFFATSLLGFGLSLFPSAAAAEKVRIGALFPFSGPLALLGQETFNGATIAADIVNEKGGIWGKQIEWVKGDGVDPKKVMTECERLISVEGLKLIFGTYSSSRSYAASEVAERNRVIYWEQGAIADPITERGLKYLFRTCPRASQFGIMAAGLNPRETEGIIEIIKAVSERGITLFIIEHVMKAIMTLSDRIIVLHHGQKIAGGTPVEISRDKRVIDAYLGEEYLA